jgi:hypothetical protein
MLGLSLLTIGVSGYLPSSMPDWLTVSWPAATASAPTAMTFKRFEDRQVSFDLPSGWRWLAQKSDGSEAEAAYFPISRFQGQNPLREPVSLRVDGIPNAQHLAPDELLSVIAKGVDSKPEAIRHLTDLPEGMVGMTFPTIHGKRTMEHFVFVKPGGHLSYVLALGSADERFTPEMARRIARTFQVSL